MTTEVKPAGERQVPPDLPPITDELHVPPSGLGQMTLSQVARGLAHYRPVLVVIGAIVALALLLPGPRRVVADTFSSAPVAESSSVQDVVTGGEEPVAEEPVAPVDSFAGGSAFDTGFATSPSTGFSTGSFDSGSGTSSSASSSGSESDSASTASSVAVAAVRAPQPLRVKESAWASRTAGTPLASEGVPAGSLPVGKRLGQDDKQSFVRLTGDAPTLVLRPAAPEGQRSAEQALIQACPVNDAYWSEGEAIAWDARPTYATEGCVAGKRAPDGSWSFDLSAFADRGGLRGFALVPAAGAPLDFQVAFSKA